MTTGQPLTPISGLSPGDLVLTHSSYIPLPPGTPLLVLELEASRYGLGDIVRLRVVGSDGECFTVEQHWVHLISRLSDLPAEEAAP